MNARIDFESIASRVDLVKLAESLGIEVRNGRAFCPFHENTNSPAMSIFLRGGRWRYLCHSCGKKGDGVAFYAAYHNVSMIDAARQLGGIDARPEREATPRPTPSARPEAGSPKPSAIVDPEWQATLDEVIGRAEELLWSPEGVDARAYLASRGLAEHVIRRFRLGFVARGYETRPLEALRDKDGRPRPIYVARGIVLPWIAPEAWYSTTGEPPEVPRWVGANVRRLMPDVFQPMPANHKCLALLGSARGYGYPWADLLPSQIGPPALIVEGEFDALLAYQEGGHLAHAMTVGGSSQAPHASAIDALALCPTWLLALDHDEAGVRAALKWRDRAPQKARRVLLPSGKDIGEFVQAGGDLRGWIADEIELAESHQAIFTGRTIHVDA